MANQRKGRRQFWHQLPPVAPPAGPLVATLHHRTVKSPRATVLRKRFRFKRTRPVTQGAVTTTFYFPRTAADTVAGGASAWTNPSNATLVDDGTLATNTASGNKVLDAIDLTNIDWGSDLTNIQNAQAILGIQVQPKWSYTGGGTVNATTVQLLLSGLVIGNNKGSGATAWGSNGASTSYGTVFGSTSDLWGTTLRGADLASSSFGIRLQGTETDGSAGTITLGKVGQGNTPDGNTVTTNWAGGGTNTAGSTLVAILSGDNNNSTLTPTTPSGWTLRSTTISNQGEIYIYEKVNASAISGLTINYSTGGASPVNLDIMEWQNAGSFDSISTVSTQTNSTTFTTNGITTVAANTVLIGIFQTGSNVNWSTPGAGFTQTQAQNASDDGTLFIRTYETYKVVSSTQSGTTTTAHTSGNAADNSIMVAYAAAVSGATAQLDAVKVTVTYIPGPSGINIVPTTKHRFAKSPRLKNRIKWAFTKRRIAPYVVGSVPPANPIVQTLRHRNVKAPRPVPLAKSRWAHSVHHRVPQHPPINIIPAPQFERVRLIKQQPRLRIPRVYHSKRRKLPIEVLTVVTVIDRRGRRHPAPTHPALRRLIRHRLRRLYIPNAAALNSNLPLLESAMLSGGLWWE